MSNANKQSFYIVYDYYLWILLNIGLPVLAAFITYFFNFINLKKPIPPAPFEACILVIGKSFSGGDNFIVASIICAVLFFEIKELDFVHKSPWLWATIKVGSLTFSIAFTILFGAFKFYSLTPQADAEMNNYGAITSALALIFSCTIAIVFKTIFTLLTSKNQAS